MTNRFLKSNNTDSNVNQTLEQIEDTLSTGTLKVNIVSSSVATNDTNIVEVGGNNINSGSGNVDTGTQRITIATDDTNMSIINTNTGNIATNTSNIKTDTQQILVDTSLLSNCVSASKIDQNLISVNGNTINVGSGTIGTGTQRVTIATNDSLISGTNTLLGGISTNTNTTATNTTSISSNLITNRNNTTDISTYTNTIATNTTNLNNLVNVLSSQYEMNIVNRNEILNINAGNNDESIVANTEIEDFKGWKIYNTGAGYERLLTTLNIDINPKDRFLVFSTRLMWGAFTGTSANFNIKLKNTSGNNDSELDLQVGYKSTSASFITNVSQIFIGTGTVDNIVTQSNFSHDKLDGTGFSGINLTTDTKYSFRTIYNFTNGDTFFQIFSPNINRFITFDFRSFYSLANNQNTIGYNQLYQVNVFNTNQTAGQEMYVDNLLIYTIPHMYIDLYDRELPCNQIYFSSYLENSSAYEITGDYSSSATSFTYTSPSDRITFIKRFIIKIEDGSIDPADFGGISSGLTNGFTLSYNRTSTSTELFLAGTDQVPLKKNGDIGGICYDFNLLSGTGDDVGLWRYSPVIGNRSIILYPGGTIQANFNDNLTALSSFRIQVQGLQYKS